MAVSDQIERIKTNIANAYTTAETMGATMPEVQNSENLSTTIGTIPSGGGGESKEVYGIIIDSFHNTINYDAKGARIRMPKDRSNAVFPYFKVDNMASWTWANLEYIIVEEGPKTLAANFFSTIDSLKTLVLPESITTLTHPIVQTSARNLEYIVFKGMTPPTFSANTFQNTKVANETFNIYVHTDAIPAYADYLNSMEGNNIGVFDIENDLPANIRELVE